VSSDTPQKVASNGGNNLNTEGELGAQLWQGPAGGAKADSLLPTEIRKAQSLSSDPKYSVRYVWYVISLLTMVNVFNYMDRMALAVLAPSIKADLQLSDGELGLLIGFAFAIFYAICGIPIGRWADRGIRRNIIAIALAMWSVMTALSGAAQNFSQLFVARIGIGAGEAGCLPPAQSILCDYVPLRRRSGVFAIHNCGLVGGMMLGMTLAGWLGEAIGWRWTFVVFGLPGLALAVIVRLTLREPSRGSFDSVEDKVSSFSFGRAVGVLARCRTYRWLVFFLVVLGFVSYGLSQWWPSYYARVYGLRLSSVGVYLGVALGAGSGVGLLIGGLLANRAAERDVRSPLIIGAAVTVLALPTALGSLFVSSAFASIFLVSLTAMFWSVSNGPVIATLFSVTPPRLRATAGSITILFTSVLGFGLGPFCVGMLSETLTSSFGILALRYALLAPICLLPVMVVALYAAAKALPNDLRAAGVQVEIDDSVEGYAQTKPTTVQSESMLIGMEFGKQSVLKRVRDTTDVCK
jgi:predicted MFS family arabinose efflux permease